MTRTRVTLSWWGMFVSRLVHLAGARAGRQLMCAHTYTYPNDVCDPAVARRYLEHGKQRNGEVVEEALRRVLFLEKHDRHDSKEAAEEQEDDEGVGDRQDRWTHKGVNFCEARGFVAC